MKVSVVVPTYNHAEFIEDTLDSILAQDYEDIEIIVVDGASTDGTSRILAQYEHRLAMVISEPDEGQTDALRKGFDVATGEIYAYLNSDDLYEPSTVREAVEFLTADPKASFVYGDATWIDRSSMPIKVKREIPFHRWIWLRDYNYIPQPSAFWRKELYDQVGGFNVSFNLAMDTDLWDRFSQVTHPQHISRYWSRMRMYPEQKNRALREDSDKEDGLIRSRNGLNVDSRMFAVERGVAKVARGILKLRHRCFCS